MIQLFVKTKFSLLFTNKVQAPSVISSKNTCNYITVDAYDWLDLNT